MVQNITNYTFDYAAKQITLTGVTANVEKVRLIKNLTTNTYIYKFTDALTISAAGSVLTFTGSNAGMANTDDLLIQYDLDTSLDTQKVSIGTDGQVAINGLTYPISTSNSTSAQLAAGQIFDGTIETIQNQQSLQISVVTDQPLLVRVISYLDAAGTKVVDDNNAIFFLEKNSKLNKNIQLPADYFRVRIINQGIASTTTFQCGVTFGIMTSVPSVNLSMPNIGTDEGLPTRSIPQSVFRTTFAKTLASTWDTDFWTRISLGSGMVNSQSSGNAVITTGTTANSETILRSNKSFRGSFRLKEKTILSQRIINQQFFVELVDVIGDLDAIVINSATSVTVTIPNNPFTSDNVGQSMYLGAYVGTGTFIPGRYAIASVSGNNVTYTVAGFAVGSGTCSIFGWNYHHIVYDTATATNAKYDSQRNGWATGDSTITINTTASPGHLLTMRSEDGEADVIDQLVASATTIPTLVRGTRVENICNETTQLWIQIRAVNGSTAPASTTTWTLGMLSFENYATQPISIHSARTQGINSQLPIRIDNVPAVTINSGTISTLSQFVAAAALGDATANPTTTGARAFNALYNGTTWDLSRNNVEVTLLASAARTTTQTSADLVNYNFKKLTVVLDMTVVGTGSVTVSIDGKDTASGKYYNILTGAAITTNSTNRYRIGETLAAVANLVAQDYLPRIIRIVVTANNANTATYSVGYNFGL